MKYHTNIVSIWLSKKRLSRQEYFAYRAYDACPYRFADGYDELAKSRFEADFSLTFDDSFMEEVFKAQPVRIPTLLKGLASCKNILDEIETAAKRKSIRQANCALIIPNFGFDRDGSDNQPAAARIASQTNRMAPLKFIGSFDVIESSADPPDIQIPMRKTRLVLVKHDSARARFSVFALERKGSELSVREGFSNTRLRCRSKSFASSADANSAMHDQAQMKLSNGFRVETRWSDWIHS